MSACATCGHAADEHDKDGCWHQEHKAEDMVGQLCECDAYEPDRVKEETSG